MRASTAFNRVFSFVTLVAVVVIFIWLNSCPDYRSSGVLQNSYQINDRLWFYTTRNSSGGATVPVIYRYFLSGELSGNSEAQTKQLIQQTPFLVDNGSISAITASEGNKVKIVYSGDVLSLERTVTYSVREKTVSFSLSYQIN